jgi:hypothetical protein
MKYVCARCGSDRISFSLDASWNIEEQAVELTGGHWTDAFCDSCEDFTKLDWVEVEPTVKA